MTQDEHFQRWLNLPSLTPVDRQALHILKKDPEAFASAFAEPLTFGTAGLRGIMGMGPAQMNDVTVSWASAGVAHWLAKQDKSRATIIVCGDNRYQSQYFSQVTARTLAAYGHQVILWQDPTPVPVLSWSIRHYGADAGIAITASHNPKEYNGFKVYDKSGAQLLAKDCKIITEAFNDFLRGQNIVSLPPFNEALQQGNIQIISRAAGDLYINALCGENGAFSPYLKLHEQTPLKILYTPLHGTGAAYVIPALSNGSFDVQIVDSQASPHEDFPTLTRPNPEDSNAFAEALQLASRSVPDIIIATDPDCDRLGLSVRHGQDYVFLNGNQIAALMIDFLSAHAPHCDNGVVISSVVSSPFAKKLAIARGLRVRETLTGFKYIGNLAEKISLENEEYFFFGYEESCGFLCGNHSRDKDGVLASILIAAAARVAKANNQTLIDRLNTLYQEVGYWYDHNFDITLPITSKSNIASQTMNHLRSMLPTEICGCKIDRHLDYQHGILSLPPENLLQFSTAENGSLISIRPSGTEPKIKCYISATANSLDDARLTAESLANHLRSATGKIKELT